MASKIVTFTLNGKETEVMVKPLTTLAKALVERMGDQQAARLPTDYYLQPRGSVGATCTAGQSCLR